TTLKPISTSLTVCLYSPHKGPRAWHKCLSFLSALTSGHETLHICTTWPQKRHGERGNHTDTRPGAVVPAHTHTDTLTHTQSLSVTHTNTNKHTQSLSVTHTHMHTHTHTHSLSLSHTHTRS